MGTRRIVFVTPLHFDENSYLGGGERYPLNLAHGIVGASGGGDEVEILSYGHTPADVEVRPGLRVRVLEQHNRPFNSLDALSWELPAALAGADVVHLHQAYTRGSEVALVAAKQQRLPVCLTDHGGASTMLAKSLGSLDLADQIICYSDYAMSLFRTRTPIAVVKGGVDATFFCPSPEPVEPDRVLYVGRLLPHKGIDRLIEALPPELPLTVCGRVQAHETEYFTLLQALARTKQVEFVTDASDHDLRQLYRRSWATVLPSTNRDCYGQVALSPELMGLTLLESMACGTPAICSRVGAMPEFVDDGHTGFVFDNLSQLAERLRLLAHDAEVRKRMGAEARQTVVRNFDREVVGRQVADVYTRMLANSSALPA